MKKSVVFLTLLLNSFLLSQEKNNIEKDLNSLSNELKLGVVSAIAGPALNVEYERILNKYSSIGGNVFLGFGELDYQYNLAISPYYRVYFTNTREYGTKGFFVQGFTSFFSGSEYEYNYDPITYEGFEEKNNFLDLAIGFAVGTKWVNKLGFVFQANIGVARSLMLSDHSDEAILLGDLSVGYRF